MSLLSQFVKVNLSPLKSHNLKTKSFTDERTAPFDTASKNTALAFTEKIGQRFPVDQVDTHNNTHDHNHHDHVRMHKNLKKYNLK